MPALTSIRNSAQERRKLELRLRGHDEALGTATMRGFGWISLLSHVPREDLSRILRDSMVRLVQLFTKKALQHGHVSFLLTTP